MIMNEKVAARFWITTQSEILPINETISPFFFVFFILYQNLIVYVFGFIANHFSAF